MEFLLIPVFSVLAVIGLALTVDTSTVIFDPIEVPPEWQNRGYTANVVSFRLTDEIRRMNEAAVSLKRGRGVRLGSEKTVTHELGKYLGLAAPIWIVRRELGLIKITVGGEIVLKDADKKKYQFLMRSTSGSTSVFTYTECGSIDEPDRLIRLAAEEALRVIDPYILAAYYFDREEDAFYKALDAAPAGDAGGGSTDDAVAELDADDTCGPEQAKKIGPFHNTEWAIQNALKSLPRAELKWPYDLLGLVYMVKKEYKLAIEKFKLALAIDPNFPIALHNWGLALAQQGSYREAIAKYQEAAAVGGTDLPGIYNAWAVALGKLGYTKEALSTFHIVMKMDPDYADAHHNLGALYESLGETKKAVEYYQRAVALDPTGEGYQRDHNQAKIMMER